MTPAGTPTSTSAAGSTTPAATSAPSETPMSAVAPLAGSQTASCPVTEKLAPAVVTPAIGARIEVLWQLESTEADGTVITESRWWGAVVQAAERGADGKTTHILLYDSFGEFGEDVASVCFGVEDTLIDLARTADESGGQLHWREEGSAEDPRAEPVSLREFIREQEDMEIEGGESITDAATAALGALPADKQLELAAGYRAFADRVKGMLVEIANSKGPGYVVTEGDIRTIFRTLEAEGITEMPPGML